jgi:hypothetical protein
LKSPTFLRLFGFILPVLLAGCQVLLIGAYDQTTDQSIQKIQVDLTTVLVQLESNFDNYTAEKNDFKNFIPSYNVIAAELENLETRCRSLPKYDIVLAQVVLLDSSVQKFETLHKMGLNRPIVETSKSLFETTFSAMIVLQNGLKREKSTK